MKSLTAALGLSLAIILGLSAAAPRARAAVVTRNFVLSGSGFSASGGGSVLPVDPASVDFTVTFNDSVVDEAATTGLVINATNVPYGWQFAYNPTGDLLNLATQAGPLGCAIGAGSACAYINGATGAAPTVTLFQQSTSDGVNWTAANTNLTYSSLGVVAAPEPAAWATMLLGLAGLGGALRARRKAVAAAI